ncbi:MULTISPECIES: aldehyde dehydrogenase (NADP(+)) [Sphingobium]|uniref:aldehyde dehydrogenase (NADP(+)) n=1 Tax=Sphingobium TaxID=165695 RepID=UPI0015EB2A07|nr:MULTISPECIES: aldehyde dehydrogenase (NADP(+)) [Sphingobium]MCW2362292.1 NADP-dependent aldehyde dehydrogenase [Sphingobium sp. B10D3B]MCW2401029.1 NADP-dependent aldehyde dehydrogenase [Sphingobium sp. B10D7B]MCW2408008.1 NADP-dependent aldehyde dehydrogenase [Sphingobium xanthum]
MSEFRSITAETGAPYGDPLPVHGPQDVAAACAAAEAAFEVYRATSREDRARFLERCGEEIMALGDGLIETAMRESGLPRARLEGERGRTVGQLRMFADVVRKGWWQQLRVDPAMPERQPLPRPDLRMRMIPLGPVAVFGASNFPLAFSTAGGDTASALAAGCPVVVKGHPAHPITASLMAQALTAAVKACDLPAGVFSQIMGPSHELGAALVQDPRITAVGFTGSRAGGLALVKLAQARPVPIPVYAEMSSINPVLLLPQSLKAHGAALGTAFVGSLTMGAGQFCTNPGLLIAMEGDGLDAFIASATEGVAAAAPQTMLTTGIRDAYGKGVAALTDHEAVETLASGDPGEGTSGGAILFQTSAQAFLANPDLADEVFGASGILVRCADEAEVMAILKALEGQLTATLHMDAEDEPLAARLLPVLERKVGRILANGWPTGVEVCHAMVHGGPFPATSDGRTTSVGSLAIDRFLRPVSYQNLAQSVLPEPLRDTALGDGIPRLYDGTVLAGR